MYHSKILVSWLSSKSAYPELAYELFKGKRYETGITREFWGGAKG